MAPSKTPVAYYARVSSEQQAQSETIASQIDELLQRIQLDGYEVPPHLAFCDDGFTGSNLARPALERLRDQIAMGAIERLYVLAPDRLARKYAHQVLLLEEFRHAQVEVVFLNRPIGKSPEDDLLLQVQGMIAEYERAKILERSRRGRLHAAKQGRVSVLHAAPYGYRYLNRHQADGEARLEIHPEQAEVVRCIFRWVAEEHCTLGEVVRRLKKAGIPSPKGKDIWGRGSVASLLNNSTYQGKAMYGKSRRGEPRERLRPHRGNPQQPRTDHSRYETQTQEQIAIPTPALVSAELFAQVAQQMSENRKRHRLGERGAKYLLQGIIECGLCGHAFYGKPVTSVYKGKRSHYTYYRCVGCEPYRTGGVKVCDNRQVRTDRLESAVWSDVVDLLSDPKRLEAEAQRRLGAQPEHHAEKDRLQEQIRRVRVGLSRVMDAYETGQIERPEFEERMNRLKQRLVELEQGMRETENAAATARQMQEILLEWQKFADRVQAGINEADWGTKRSIIRALLKRIEVAREEIRLIYRVPPQSFHQTKGCGFLQDCHENAHSSEPTKYVWESATLRL